MRKLSEINAELDRKQVPSLSGDVDREKEMESEGTDALSGHGFGSATGNAAQTGGEESPRRGLTEESYKADSGDLDRVQDR